MTRGSVPLLDHGTHPTLRSNGWMLSCLPRLAFLSAPPLPGVTTARSCEAEPRSEDRLSADRRGDRLPEGSSLPSVPGIAHRGRGRFGPFGREPPGRGDPDKGR